jgi:succinate dehydrogenase hydrophobic anchor subunit
MQIVSAIATILAIIFFVYSFLKHLQKEHQKIWEYLIAAIGLFPAFIFVLYNQPMWAVAASFITLATLFIFDLIRSAKKKRKN